MHTYVCFAHSFIYRTSVEYFISTGIPFSYPLTRTYVLCATQIRIFVTLRMILCMLVAFKLSSVQWCPIKIYVFTIRYRLVIHS